MQERFQALLDAGTAVISDVFDALGEIPPVLQNSLRPIGTRSAGFVGPAYTITGCMGRYAGADRSKLTAIDEMPRGAVALWAGTDVTGVCLFGDLLASAMQARGCAGAIVDGGVRDVAFLRQSNLPVFARYCSPAQGIGRWRVTAWQVLVRVRGALQEWIEVRPGDVLAADDDGVIAIPQQRLDEVVLKVQDWARSEKIAREEIRQGLPLLRALEKYGHL